MVISTLISTLVIQDTRDSDYALLTTLFLLGLAFISFWVGSQRSAEELYIQQCSDKCYAQGEIKQMTVV
jgi:hypothetical protein